jgi:hypothetical protein
MSIEKTMQALAPRDRALVAVAVLLDGREAGSYLTEDALCGDALQRAAQSLAQLPPEVRMPLAGTVLRESLEEMSR